MQNIKRQTMNVNNLIRLVASSFDGFLYSCAEATKKETTAKSFRYGGIICQCELGLRSNLFNWSFSDGEDTPFFSLKQISASDLSLKLAEATRIKPGLKKLAAHLIVGHLSSKATGGYHFISEAGKEDLQGTFVLNEGNQETIQFVGELYYKAKHAESSSVGTQIECVVTESLEEKITEATFGSSFFVGFPISKLPGAETIMEEILSNWPHFQVVMPNQERQTIQLFRDYFTSERNRDFLFHEIVDEASRYPLIHSLIGSGHYKQARTLLRVLTKVQFNLGTGTHKGKVVASKPVVSPPWQEISNKILFPIRRCVKSSNYTSHDYILALGRAACIAGKDDNSHSFSTFDPRLQETSDENQGNMLQGYIADAIKNEHIVETEFPNTYRFANKLYRLYFDAMSSALIDSKRWAGGRDYECAQIGVHRMMNVSGTQWEKKHNKTSFFAEQAFSAETFYAITYLEYVDNSHRRILIRELIQCALDFKVRNKNRDKQAKAISILCYLLIEKGHEFTSEERREIFEAAFGRTLYKFQGILWGALREQSEYYKRYAYEVFQSSLGVPIMPSLVGAYKGKPLFFFLAPHLFEKDFEVDEHRHPAFFYFMECLKFYRKTWYLSVNDVISHDDVVSALEKVRVYGLDEANTEKDTKSVPINTAEVDIYLSLYGTNALLYGLSNIKNHIAQINRKKREKEFVSASDDKQSKLLDPLVQYISIWSSQSQNAIDIYRSILRCDFNNRKYAKNYGSFDEDYFLLAGPVRFICAYYKELSEQIDSPISIDNNEMTQMYKNWMSFQMKKDSRYGFLLSKLLSFSDFDLDPFVSVQLFADTSFLSYDNIGDNYQEFAKECLFRWDAKRFSEQSQ